MRVDLAVASGSQVALYLNDLSDPPQLRPLVPHERTVYEFEGPAGDIERIRLDVLDATGSQIRYSGIQVRDEDGEVLADFPPSDLASWAGYSVAPAALEPDAYAVIAPGASRRPGRVQEGHCPERLAVADRANDSRRKGAGTASAAGSPKPRAGGCSTRIANTAWPSCRADRRC